MSDFRLQSLVFSHYLIRRLPNETAVLLYEATLKDNKTPLSTHDKKLLSFMLRHPATIGPIDAALAITQPQSEIRRRLYVMFSILEAQPDHASLFLSSKRRWWYWLYVLCVGIVAVIKLLVGLILIKVVTR